MGVRFTDEDIRRGHEEHKQFTSMMARNFGGLSLRGNRLEEIRLAGNDAFAHQHWTEALRAYSTCIAMGAGGHLEVTGRDAEEYKRVIKLAYSNRAETRLRLREFEFALKDANEALQIDPNHVKTLVRKGKAAQGLALYEMACEAFKLALTESPQEQSIVDLLRGSTIAHQQSQTGNYDLTNFFASGGTGEIPFCADFLGPVDIRRRDGGWGLFATKSLEPGELLLVTNPLVVIRDGVAPGRSEEWNPLEAVVDLTRDLAYQILRSKRQMAQFYSLGNHKELEMGIPSMELFRPGSDWIPSGAAEVELNMNQEMNSIYEIAQKKKLQYSEMKGPNEQGCITHVTGLWVLPALAKHSCAPNCQHSFVGDAIFFRASGRVMEGEELTIAYFNDLYNDVARRQETCKSWMFTCKCDRCVFEESIQPQLSKFSTRFQHRIDAALSISFQKMGKKRKRSVLKELAVATNEIEAVIQSFGRALLPQQQGWIRAAFIPLYMSKFQLAMVENDSEFQSAPFKVFIDAMTSVYLTPPTLSCAAMLLTDADASYSKASQHYKDALDGVLGICRVLFGNQPDTVLLDHVNACIPPDFQ